MHMNFSVIGNVVIFVLLMKESENKNKKLPPVGIKPGTLELWGFLSIHPHAFLTELT